MIEHPEEQVVNQHFQCKGLTNLWYTAHRLHEIYSQDSHILGGAV